MKDTDKADIIVESKTRTGAARWGFTLSMTGQLDYTGRADSVPDSSWQTLEASTYFSPAWYTWLPENLCADIHVYVSPQTKIPDADTFAYLTHIGALLAAVEAKDGLLAAELFNRRSSIFMKFAQLTLYIIEPVAVEGLFGWLYGQFADDTQLRAVYSGNTMFSAAVKDTPSVFYEAAKKRLNPDPSKETIDEMFIRYFKEHDATEITIGVVGAGHYDWALGISYINSIAEQNEGSDFVNGSSKVSAARNTFFASLSTAVQAEPYNPHDANAVVVYADDIQAKIRGNGGKVPAGHLRATGAAVIRKAKPQTFSYSATLARLGDTQDGEEGIVVRIKV